MGQSRPRAPSRFAEPAASLCYTIDPGVCQVIKWGVGPEAPTGPACPPTQVRGDCHTIRELEEGVRIEGGEIERGVGGAGEDRVGQTLGESQTQNCCWYILVYLAL